jgi:hypothetical protein
MVVVVVVRRDVEEGLAGCPMRRGLTGPGLALTSMMRRADGRASSVSFTAVLPAPDNTARG